MSWKIKTVSDFDREAKRLLKKYRSLPSDLKALQNILSENPFMGTEIMPGVRKIRMAIESKGKGKSGGARVIYYISVADSTTGNVYLLYIYDKSETSTIKNDYIIKLLNELGLS